MKKLLFLFVCAVAAMTAAAQDKLITTDGDVYVVYNVEVTGSSVMYTTTNSATADIQKIEKSKVLIIKRPDGTNYDLGTTEAPSKMVTTDGDVKQIYVVELGTDIVYYKDAETPYSEVQNINKSDVLMIKKADGTNYDLGAINTSSTEIASSSTLSESTTSTTSTSTSSSDDISGRLLYEFVKPKSGWGLQIMHFQIGYVDLGWMFGFGETNSYIKDNDWNKVFLGGCYEFGANPFYIDLAAGLMYTHTKISIYSNKKTETSKDGVFGLYLNPRINLYFCTFESGGKLGLTGGYHWDFNKFKFDEAYTDKYWSIGIVGAF